MESSLAKSSRSLQAENAAKIGGLTAKMNAVMTEIEATSKRFEEAIGRCWARYSSLYQELGPTKEVRAVLVLYKKEEEQIYEG